ncbi:metallochaperone AztD [Pseudooceanicola aestuarii]|uniref:metallochaperone AztD n=1 Tax=Pseudooceanicola aestuarii TaxID=2697319 RepID=UPI001EF8FEB1|nr:metallochaperone AztD [Pseudooceanicola aestuarii]
MLRTRMAQGAVAMLALAAAQGALADEDRTAWRLFIADQADGTVTVVDRDTPDQRWSFDFAGPSRLYGSPSGQAVIAVQSDDDRVDFLSSGIALEGHGDHSDIAISDPAAMDAHLTGPRPFHVVTHGHETAINFDQGGYVSFLSEGPLQDGTLEVEEFAQNRAHHGFAAPLGNVIVSSVASEGEVAEGSAPPRVGIAAYDADGTLIGDVATCTDLHGEAFSGSYLLAGCKEGVIAVSEADEGAEFTMLSYPEDFPEEKTGTLLGSAAMQIFLGDFGRESVVIIDPTTEPYFTRVELSFRRVDFVLDPAIPQFAYILTEDGTLHRLNMLSAEIEASARITQPYSMDGHWRDPRPRLAVAGDRIALTDPLQSLVRLVDPASLEETATIPVEGLPYNILAIGGSGLTH